MDRKTLEAQIDSAVALYAQNKDPALRDEIGRITFRLTEFRHFETLENAFEQCRVADMRTAEVKNALTELSKVFADPWPLRQFAAALDTDNEEGRWQIANAALNAIRNFITR